MSLSVLAVEGVTSGDRIGTPYTILISRRPIAAFATR
jgi:hypothetical protein